MNYREKEPQDLFEDPVGYMYNLGLYFQGTGWRGYNDYIGNEILYPGFSKRMKETVLANPKVNQVVRELAEHQAKSMIELQKKKWKSPKEKERRLKQLEKLRKKELEVVAKQITEKAVSAMDSKVVFRSFAFTVQAVLMKLYHQGLHIRESEWVELKRVALMAQEKKQSLILLPSHKSHIDYMVVSYIMYRLGVQIPHIIAGDNLDMPVVGKLLKNAGAVYIRREWGGDKLYKTILEEYIATLLAEGMNFECFVEGTRSRLGKLLQPKLGVVKIILDSIISGRTTDCHIVPISIGYDKIIETSSYATELLGKPKEKESLLGVLSSSKLLQLKWGRVDIRLGKPFSLKDWVDDQLRTRSNLDVSNVDHKAILMKSFGYRVLADINAISVVMPSALIGTVILTLRGRGVGRSELIRRVDWLKKAIEQKGGQVSEFYGMSTGDVVDRTLLIHKDLIGERKEKDIIEPTFYPIAPFELSYYRNQVIHLFIEEAIVCAALYTVIKKGGGKPLQRMKYEDLLDEVTFLSSILKLEMIFKPGRVEDNTARTVRWLIEMNVIEMSDDGMVGLSDYERECGRENFDFLCFLIWPFIESYWLASITLFTLAPPNKSAEGNVWVDYKLFSNRAQSLGKTLYYQGDLSYLEAANKETLTTAFTRYRDMNILIRRYHPTPKPWSEVTIGSDYTPERQNGILVPRGHLWELVDRIGRFRREGKNRRDNATVSTRVLRIADILGEHNSEPSPNQKQLAKNKAKL
ncbi:putative acyltransferase [Backusella circina FSU 941]|nr:putative acyltransferase [Backusella circina FSU 941]